MAAKRTHCNKCGKLLTKESGYLRKYTTKTLGNTYGYEASCRVCARKLALERYTKHKEQNDGFTRHSTAKIVLMDHVGNECLDCGLSDPHHPEIFDFHHMDPDTKSFGISKYIPFHLAEILGGNPPNELTEELALCVLLCSNCHRKRHGGHNT